MLDELGLERVDVAGTLVRDEKDRMPPAKVRLTDERDPELVSRTILEGAAAQRRISSLLN
jgi:hypothetical protein